MSLPADFKCEYSEGGHIAAWDEGKFFLQHILLNGTFCAGRRVQGGAGGLAAGLG